MSNENYIVRNFLIKNEDGTEIAKDVAISVDANNVYFIEDSKTQEERSLNDVLFGNQNITALINGNDSDFISRIQTLENKEVKITEVPINAIENKYKTDANSDTSPDGAVLNYAGFKKMRDLEAKSCKSESVLAIAEGSNNVAGKLGLTINHILKKTDEGTGETTYTLVCGKGLNQITVATVLELYRNVKEYQGYVYCNIQWNYCFNNIKTEIYYGNDLLLSLNRYIMNSATYPLRLTFTEDNFPTYLKNLATEQEEEIALNENTPFPNGVVYLYVYKNDDTTQPVSFITIPNGVDIGVNARAFGQKNTVLGANSFASGYGNIVYGANSFAMGVDNKVDYCSYADGRECIARGKYAHAEGRSTIAGTISTDVAHAEGNSTQALGESSHAEGHTSWALGSYAHASGARTIAFGKVSHTEGISSYFWPEGTNPADLTKEDIINQWNRGQNVTAAIGDYSHAEGQNNLTVGIASHAEGYKTQALGDYAHTEGIGTKALGGGSHSEGYETEAFGFYSHNEGYRTINYGDYSHVEGQECRIGVDNTAAEKIYHAHAEGKGTVAFQTSQHVQGQYNEIGSKNDETKYAHIVGWGSSDSDRKNIHTLTTTGDAWFAGDVSAKSFTLNGNTITDWPTGGGSDYELPAATESTLGGIKISFDNGVLTIET